MKNCVSFFTDGVISYPGLNLCVVPCTFSIVPGGDEGLDVGPPSTCAQAETNALSMQPMTVTNYMKMKNGIPKETMDEIFRMATLKKPMLECTFRCRPPDIAPRPSYYAFV